MVRMHNHLVTANFGYFELLSMRIFLLMIAKLRWDDKDLLPIRINLCDILPSYKGGDHLDLVIKACRELKSKMHDVEILSINAKGKKVYERMTVIDNVKYVEETDYIEAEFGRKIKPYLIDLKEQFTQAELHEIITIKSSHAIRLYLLVKSLYRSGQVYTTTVNDLKMMLLGSTELYPEYKIFKRAILKQTQTLLADTSAAFEFEEERKGRSVEILHIKPCTYPKALSINCPLSDSLRSLLEEHKVNLTRIREMLLASEISESYILYVVEAKLKDSKVKKTGGAIYNAIVNKQLWAEYQLSLSRPLRISAASSPMVAVEPKEMYTRISLADAQKMYEQEKPKYPFAGFVKAMKTGRKILVEGYIY